MLRLEGEYRFQAGIERVWSVLNDQGCLQRATPGCKSLIEVAPDEYDAQLEIGVAAIKGKYRGKVAIRDKRPGQAYRLVVTGQGAPGFVKATVDLQLQPDDPGTVLRYGGDATVGGLVASVGQRMIGGVAKMMIEQFFQAIDREVQAENQVGAADPVSEGGELAHHDQG